MKIWRSEFLPWLALGAAFTSVIAVRMSQPDPMPRRNYYVSREQCLRDYDEFQCRSGSGSGFYGPHYRGERQTANDPGPGRTAVNGESAAASRAVRGGFSSTARSGYGGYRGG